MPTRRALRRAAVLALLGVLLHVRSRRGRSRPVSSSPRARWTGGPGWSSAATGPIAVTVDGQPQPITTTPLVSDRSAMALVVDASAGGGPGLQPGLGGLVDFALGAPPATRTALVADTTPPAVVVPLQAGPAGVLTGLSGITLAGRPADGRGAGPGRRAAAARARQPAPGRALHGAARAPRMRPTPSPRGCGPTASCSPSSPRRTTGTGARSPPARAGWRWARPAWPSSTRSARSRAPCARGRW